MPAIMTRHQLVTVRGTRSAVAFLAVCAVGLIPWTAGLAVTLPAHYVVGSWTLTWTGFDIALLASFAVTAWALAHQRPIALPAAVFTSALLLCDAWFDVLTAHGGHDLLVSSASALLGEIPAAIILAVMSMKLLRANAALAPPPRPRDTDTSLSLVQTPRPSDRPDGEHHALHPAPRPDLPTPRSRRTETFGAPSHIQRSRRRGRRRHAHRAPA